MGTIRVPVTDENRPEPKSKNRKSLGPSLRESPGTRATAKGKADSQACHRSGTKAAMTGLSARAKKGTVRRSSRMDKGQTAANKENAQRMKTSVSRRETSSAKTASTSSKRAGKAMKRPASASRGKNSSRSSSRRHGQA